jgi:Leucine-rich repeat (LRR) protein
MQKVMFFNFDYMGLGGLWQNISWLLTNQKKPLEINLHLNEKNIGKFIEIYRCFKQPKYPVEIKIKETIHLNIDLQKSWKDNLKNLKVLNYSDDQIQTIPCTLRHEYYPTKFKREIKDHIGYYFIGPEETYNGYDYTLPRNLNTHDSILIIEKHERRRNNCVQLGPHRSIEENCKYISTAKYCIGREGGWTHVAHSCQTDYYPIMYNRHSALNYAHGKENKYLKQFQTVKEYYESL